MSKSLTTTAPLAFRPAGTLRCLALVWAMALFLLATASSALPVEQPPVPGQSQGQDAMQSGSRTPLATALENQPRRYVYGYDREFPPFSYEREGKAAGFDVELLRAVLQNQNVRILPRAMQWDQVLLELSAGNVQISSSMIKTKQRTLLYKFPSLPILPLKARFFMKNFKRVANIDQLVAKKVGVKKNSLYETMLKERGGVIVVPFETDLEALRAVQNEQVDAFFGADRTAFFLMKKTGLTGITPVGTPLSVTNVYFAVYREEEELLRMIDQGLRKVRESGEYDRLFRKWFVTELTKEQIQDLIRKAAAAAAYAYVPYSQTFMGGAVLGRTGTVYTGATVENGLSQLNASALTVAVQNAVAAGESDFLAAVSVLSNGTPVAPTAEERRLLFEFGPEILVITEPDKGQYQTLMVTQLLPYPQEQELPDLPDSIY